MDTQTRRRPTTLPPTLAMITTGEGLPALPRKWVEKIQAGEFVDFADLPPAKGKVRGTPSSLDGQIVVVQAVTSWSITS